MTTFDVRRVLDPIISHGKALGRLDVVTGHEPKSAPRGKLSAAVWVQSTDPVTSSGLNSSSIRIVVQARIYASMTSEPQDAIDPDMTNAAIEWVARLNGDLDLGGGEHLGELRGEARGVDEVGAVRVQRHGDGGDGGEDLRGRGHGGSPFVAAGPSLRRNEA